MAVRGLVVATTLVALSTAACADGSAGDPSGESGTSSAAATPAEAMTVRTSQRLGFDISVPADWEYREGLLPFERGQEPYCGSPQVDSWLHPSGNPCLFVGRMTPARAPSAERWVVAMRESATASYDDYCDPPDRPVSAVVDGHEAVMMPRRCPGLGPNATAVLTFTVAGRSGYLFVCHSDPPGDEVRPDFEAECRSWVETVRFSPG